MSLFKTFRSASRFAAFLTAASLLAPAAHGAGIFWQRTVDDPCPNQGSISCGDLGHFTFSTQHISAMRSSACQPGETYGGSSPSPGIYPNREVPDGRNMPCADGSCLASRPEGSEILVIDWDDPHGWSVAAAVREIAGPSLSVGLLDLEQDLGLGYEGVGNPQVIAQLCRIADIRNDEELPIVVNMSFGRGVDSTCTETSEALECQIDEILGHLEKDRGITLIAAAGNHGRMLFPARSEHVISAGAMDLTRHELQTQVVEAAQTPIGTNFLLPGYGVFLENGISDLWPAPPGSSYAAALASGWWAATVAVAVQTEQRLPVLQSTSKIWPRVNPLERFGLVVDDVAVAASQVPAADEVMSRALGRLAGVCPMPELHRASHELEISGLINKTSLPAIGIDDLQATTHHPCPDSWPCVPCHDLPGDPDGGGPTTTPSESLVETDVSASFSSSLVVDLSKSAGIDPSYQLLGLYLEVGTNTYAFTDSQNPVLLNELTSGDVESLAILQPPSGTSTHQTSLLFHLRLQAPGKSIDGSEVTVSIPVTHHGH